MTTNRITSGDESNQRNGSWVPFHPTRLVPLLGGAFELTMPSRPITDMRQVHW